MPYYEVTITVGYYADNDQQARGFAAGIAEQPEVHGEVVMVEEIVDPADADNGRRLLGEF